MGIDVYMRWTLQTDAEQEAQHTGFSVTHGHVGYLREAYHGEPYATKALLPECFEPGQSCEPKAIPAATLRERLPDVVQLALQRERNVYRNVVDEHSPVIRSFVDFVELAERMEAEGRGVTVVVSW